MLLWCNDLRWFRIGQGTFCWLINGQCKRRKVTGNVSLQQDTAISPQHPHQLIPFPKKATNIYGMTSLAFQTQRVPCASLQQCKASLRHNQPAWAGSSNEKIRFRSLWIKTHCVGRLFFPWELCSPSNPAAVPFFRCLRARSTEFLTSKLWGSKVSDFKLKIPMKDKMSLWPKQAWYSSPPNILGQILLQRNDKPGLQNPSPAEGTLLLLACC